VRLGIVRGHVVLNRAVPELVGTRLLLVDPLTAGNLAAANGEGGGTPLVVATDGDFLRRRLGDTTPARLAVVGLVDAVATAGLP